MGSTRIRTSLSVGIVLAALSAGFSTAEAQDVSAGEKVFKKCKACHAVGDGAKNKVGPNLNDMIGRLVGSVEDFGYSKAMLAAREAGTLWSEETLAAFLGAPRRYMKGTKMSFAGLKKQADRDNVIAYLTSFSTGAEDTAEIAAPKEGTDSTTTAVAAPLPAPKPEGPPVFTDEFLNEPMNVEAGREIWFAQCTHCHGYKAYPGKAPKLKPARYTPDFVYKRVFKGFKKMPGWGEVYSREELMKVVSYVKSQSFSP